MRVTLEATAGPGTGRKILLRTKQVARIGRTQLADYAFEDGYLSGVHFSVSFDGRECRVQDLGSSNGTFVNGQQVVEATLQSGDEIAAGGCRFRVAIDLTAPHRPPGAFPQAAERSLASAAEPAAQATEVPRPVSSATRPLPVPPPGAISRPTPRTEPLPGGPAVDVPERFTRGLADEDAAVRQAAVFAAVWTRAPWLLRHLVKTAGSPTPESLEQLRVFATLAEANHLNTILSLARNTALGPERFEVAGLFGHPAVVRDLLTAMSWDDAETAESAAAAFEKITGADLAGLEPAEAPPDEPPSASRHQAAQAFWRQEGPRFAHSARWSRGHDVGRPVGDEILRELDLESRREVLLRDHFYGRREVSLRELELLELVV